MTIKKNGTFKKFYKHRNSGFLKEKGSYKNGKLNGEWQDYYERVQECIDRRRPQDILLIGSDCNSSIGTSFSKESTVVGSFDLQHTNQSGRRLINFLAVNNMSAVSTYFPKRNYGTWRHPRSKCIHQLDYF